MSQGSYVGVSTSTIFTTKSNSDSTVVHGLTYIPNSVADIREPINTEADGASIFLGGIVAQGIKINRVGNEPSDSVAALSGTTVAVTITTPRTMLICATASPPTVDGTAKTIIQAAVVLNTTPVIESWREVAAC